MSTTKEVIKKKNEALFSMRQPSVLHDIYVVGIKVKDPNDENKRITKWVQTSSPNDAAKKAGVKASEFIHTSFKPAGTIKVVDDGEEAFSGPKKSQVGVTFASAQPDLFTFIKKAIDAGEYNKETNPTGGYVLNGEIQMTQNGKTFKRPQIKLKKKMYGRIIAINVPEYEPHNMTAEGKFEKLSPVTLDPKTGKYSKKPVVMGSIKFFADDDDLDLLEEACARIVDKRVRPFVVDVKSLTVTNEFGNGRVEKTEAENTGETPENDDVDPNEPDPNEESGN